MRPFRVSNLVIGILIPVAPSAAAQVNAALRDYVELRIEVKHWAPDARVRDSPSLRARILFEGSCATFQCDLV